MNRSGNRMRATLYRPRLVTVGAMLLAGAISWAQLPPIIEIDRLLVEAEMYGEDGNYAAMLERLDRILALADQHQLDVPVDFWFKRAEVAQRTQEYDTALEAGTRYLERAGRTGENYRAALELVIAAEAEISRLKGIVSRIEFMRVPPGVFAMGSSSSEANANERPVTRVRISQPFLLGKYEVTQGDWEAVMGSNPASFSGCTRCPVESVSWDDVMEFVRRLNQTTEGEPEYRLPTEAEWEYAARGRPDRGRYGALDLIAWYDGNSDNRPHPVGRKTANGFGLYDMLGNVGEWVHDWYGAYTGGTVTDPRGPESGTRRAWRGCPFFYEHSRCWASYRMGSPPGDSGDGLGFRLARDVH